MSEKKGKIVELDLNDILPNRFQPRIKFNEDSIMELAESIKVHGVLQPIIVRPISDKYEIIAGERRYKASIIAGLKEIPAIIISYNDKDSAEVALIENVQRKDLTSIEEAISYKKILDMGYLTQEQLASKLGKSQSAIANKIRLLNLCDAVQEALMDEKISERHARSLLKLKKAYEQRYLLKRIISERLPVRKTDEEIEKVLKGEITIEPDLDENEETSSVSVPTIELKKENEPSNKEINKISTDKINKKDNDNSEFEFDITDFFDEDDLNEFLSIINVEENNDKEKSKEEKGDDKMINGSENIGLENKNDFTPNNKINELLALEKDANLFKESEQTSVFSQEKKEETNSIFGDLLKQQDEVSDNNYVDGDMFGKFLDPSYIDGNKQEVSQSDEVSSSVFSKFLNQTNDNKDNIISNPVEFNNNSSFSQNEINEDNKFKFLLSTDSSENKDNNNDNSENQFIDFKSNDKFNSTPSIFNTSSINDDMDIFNTIESNNISGTQTIENEVKENSIFNNLETSNTLNTETNKFINLEPTVSASTQTIENEIKKDSIFNNLETSNTLNTETNKFINLEPTVSASTQTVDNSVNEEINNILTENIVEQKKPDLLAPMSPQIIEESVLAAPVKEEEKGFDNNFSSIFNFDKKEESPKDLEKEEQLEASNDNIAESISTIDKPIFITATSSVIDTAMPTTPIIDNAKENKIELSSDDDDASSEGVINEPAPVIEEIQSELEPDEVSGPVTNQTIIVTDYNKQYDPIFPTVEKNVEPQIDMKSIIGMIRELGNKIEQYGYTIDLDEIDLMDKYQVTFNIEKK